MTQEVTPEVTTPEEEPEETTETTQVEAPAKVETPTEVVLSAAMQPVVAAIQTCQEGVVQVMSEAGIEPNKRLEQIQPLLNEMSNQLVAAANRPVTPADEVAVALRSALQAELGPLVQSIQALVATMGRGADEGPPGRRTYSHVASVRAADAKPMSQIDQLARRSVGLSTGHS